MKKTRIFSKVLAVTLSLSLVSGMVFAARWDLANGSITIDTSSETQKVSQGGGEAVEDAAPEIYQSNSGTATENTITIKGGGTANVTVENLNICNPIEEGNTDDSAIDVQGTTTANITAKGNNKLSATSVASPTIRVTEGTLNLNTTEGSSVTATNENTKGEDAYSCAAGIGSGYGEHMSGNINFTGKGTVTAFGNMGAGIGSGTLGMMSGSITTGEGTVNAESAEGAGIGAGLESNVSESGSITLGKGTVNASSDSGAGIGNGSTDWEPDDEKKCPEMQGKVNIAAGAKVTVTSRDGQQIGAGENSLLAPQAQLNVQTGAMINGKEIKTPEDLKGLGIPEEQIRIEEASKPSDPGAEIPAAPAAAQSFYWVLSEGSSAKVQEVREGDVLTLTLDTENGELHLTVYGLRQLQSQGVKTIVFKTASQESSFEVAAVLDCTDLVLTHEGTKAELTLDGEASDLLK